LTREAFRVRSHCKTQDEARKNANTLSLEGVAQNITCPLFIVNGRLDRIVPAKDAERLAREAKGPVTLMMIETATTSPPIAPIGGGRRAQTG
jgi:2,6-dihydroxypseudooxynicotine hydrolase